jgi:nucleotidyltransferase AbiEii toxin of type IV toxin-antitoxin system
LPDDSNNLKTSDRHSKELHQSDPPRKIAVRGESTDRWDIVVRGYPLEMILAEKIVTALERGTASTRWRDFVDIYVLTGRYAINAQSLKSSMQRVAQFRNTEPAPLQTALNGYAAISQTRWRA